MLHNVWYWHSFWYWLLFELRHGMTVAQFLADWNAPVHKMG